MIHAAYLSTAHGRIVPHCKRNALAPADTLTVSANMADVQCRACRIGIGLPVRPLPADGTATLIGSIARHASEIAISPGGSVVVFK